MEVMLWKYLLSRLGVGGYDEFGRNVNNRVSAIQLLYQRQCS